MEWKECRTRSEYFYNADIVKSTGDSKATKIDNYYIIQRFQGIEVYNTVSNVWYKKNEVINIQNSFVTNIASKINTTSPSLTVLDVVKRQSYFDLIKFPNLLEQIFVIHLSFFLFFIIKISFSFRLGFSASLNLASTALLFLIS